MTSIPTVALSSGATMPLLGFGTWQIRGDAAYRAVRHALDAGYRHLDTATMYGNEDQVGRALRDSGLPRDAVFVTTKLPPERVGREARTLDESRRALGVDAVDLWLVHWPPGGAAPEVWRAFLAARDAGHARAVGVSNYSTAQLDELTAATGHTPAVNQVRWGPNLHDAATLAAHRDRGVVLEGYSPLRSTRLTHPVLARIAAVHGVEPARVVLRWHVQHGVVVIPKSADPGRIRANADLAGFRLTDEEMAAVDALGAG
jgi:diketogulonate reductase-like aldo/keto reductase